VLAAPLRDTAVTAAVLTLTAVAFALVADHGILVHIQRADDAWLRLMISGRAAPVTAVAKVFNWLGLVYVTLPVRIAIAGFLAWRRRWWHLAAFAVPGASAQVGGVTAIGLDVKRATAHDRNVIIPLILVVVFVILGLLLRALVAPLILTATVVLSFAASLGVSAFFFNHVFGFGGADTSFPLFVFVFLVALGIDYNIFLMTRVREEAIKRDAQHGAIIGLAATGGVITSAGFVLAGTFAVLATIPSTFLTELGFAVAFGILLDTIVVRLLLVTALNLDVGRWMWWPSKLAGKPDPAPDELRREHAEASVPG